MYPGLMLFPEVRCSWHRDKNPTRDDCKSSAVSRVRKCLLVTWKGDSSTVVLQDLKNWLTVLNSVSLVSVTCKMGLFLLQKISISTDVCSSNTMEDARYVVFSNVCWYAFIRYNISLLNTSVANLFRIFDAEVNSKCSFVRWRCILKPLWQLKWKQASQWFHIMGFSFRVRYLPGAALCSLLLDSMLFRFF